MTTRWVLEVDDDLDRLAREWMDRQDFKNPANLAEFCLRAQIARWMAVAYLASKQSESEKGDAA